MIYIGNYEKNVNNEYPTIKRVSISTDRGKKVNFNGPTCEKLIPEQDFYEFWNQKKDIMKKADIIVEYIIYYYNTVLKFINLEDLIAENSSVVYLCYEKSNQFCHRFILAEWIEMLSIQSIYEVNLGFEGPATPLKRNPYRDLIQQVLEPILKKEINMHGFNSTKAAKIYNAILEVEKEKDLSEDAISYIKSMKRMTDIIEKEYNKKHHL